MAATNIIASKTDWVTKGLDSLSSLAAKVTGVTAGIKEIADTLKPKPPVAPQATGPGAVLPGAASKPGPVSIFSNPLILILIGAVIIYFVSRGK